MSKRKRSLEQLHSNEVKSSSVLFNTERDHEAFLIERDLLARIVLKQHYAFKRLDIMDRLKVLVKHLDEIQANGKFDTIGIEKLRALIGRASERFFQQLSMGLMVPISSICLGSLSRLSALLARTKAVSSTGTWVGTETFDEDIGVRIHR